MSISEPLHIFEIFVSYSRRDARFVKPMVKYLRPTGTSVFCDDDSIQPGKKWAAVVTVAIETCRLMYVFWCSHSAASQEVRKEYDKAITLDKDIVPVLLDDTPLPQDLSEYQWIDLRDVIGRHQKTVQQVISLQEGLARRRLSNEEHRVPMGVDAYTGGDFARQGWIQKGNQYVRQVDLDIEPTDNAIRKGAGRLSEHLERRMSNLSSHAKCNAGIDRSCDGSEV